MTGSGEARPVVLITGGSYGVGAAAALAFARAGYDVALTATRLANLDATMAALQQARCRAAAFEMRLQDTGAIEAAFSGALERFGHVDVLVNNAAVNLRRLAVDVSPAEWREVMEANVTGPFVASQLFARHLIARGASGSIINVASTHALVGAPERSTYGISKAALVQMTRMLAVEWASQSIRVNAVAPGRMETASPSRARTGSNAEYMAAMLAKIPLHRLVTAEEVAEAIVYLASPAAVSITGHVLVMDGGLTAV